VTTNLLGSWIASFLSLYQLVVIAYAVMSWFQGLGSGARKVYALLAQLCEPLVGTVRRILPAALTGANGVDLSPLVSILLLALAQNLVRMLFLTRL
jgi:uncharacterized protein YggT (Ycf19 family)